MIVTEINLDLALPPPYGRSPGIHVSSIIRNIAIEERLLTPDNLEELSLVDYREITNPVALARIGLGIGWERFYIPEVLSRFHNVEDHPPELKRDGVYMTRDGESVSVIITSQDVRMTRLVHEVKCTYKSINTVLRKFSSQWLWLAQIKAYCIATGTRFAWLHVMFVCGDYSYPIRPVNRVWQLEFTQDELDRNWDLLRDYKNNWLISQGLENDHMYRIGE